MQTKERTRIAVWTMRNKSKSRYLVSAVLLVCLMTIHHGMASTSLNALPQRADSGLFIPSSNQRMDDADTAMARPVDSRILRRRIVETDKEALSQIFADSNLYPTGIATTLNLFPDVVVDVVPDRRSVGSSGSIVIEGAVAAPFIGEVIMVNFEGRLTANIHLDGKLFTIRQLANGMTTIDELSIPQLSGDGSSDASYIQSGAARITSPEDLAIPQDAAVNTNLTLLVAYTDRAERDRWGFDASNCQHRTKNGPFTGLKRGQ